MNITGQSQYSKIVSNLRDPNRRIVGQDLNLIFVYPILVPSRLPNANKVISVIRSFLSVTFLKELFIQNTISMVAMANQIQPLSDETGIKIDPNVTISQVLMNLQRVGDVANWLRSDSSPNYPISSLHRQEIQRKIEQKTAVIKKLIRTDPVLSKLDPYVEMITMGNLIDVPVIVGTKSIDIDALALFHILIAAISMNKPLDSSSNITLICDELNNLDPSRYWQLLKNLSTPVGASRFSNWFKNLGGKLEIASLTHIPKTTKVVTTVVSKFRSTRKYMSGEETGTVEDFPSSNIFDVLKLVKSQLDDARLKFRFVLDPKLLKSQTGIDTSSLKSVKQKAVEDLQPDFRKAQVKTINEFTDVLANSLFILYTTILSIEPELTTDIDLLDILRRRINDEMIPNIDDQTVNLYKILSDGFAVAEINTLKSNIDIVKTLTSMKLENLVSEMLKELRNNAFTINFTSTQYVNFVSALEKYSQVAVAKIKQVYNIFSHFDKFGDDCIGILQSIERAISESLKQIFAHYSLQFTDQNPPRIVVVLASENPNNQRISIETIKTRVIPALIDHLTTIYHFLYIAALQSAIYQFIIKAEITIDTSTSDVTRWPNYALIIPLEFILALHAVMISKGWNQLISVSTSEQLGEAGVLHVTDNYVKGIIKYVSMKLNIPNLFVVDSAKQDIYYKLMYQQQINKTKLSTLETFVQESLNKPITDQYY